MQQIDKHENRRFCNFAAEISHTPMSIKYYSDKKLLEQLSNVLYLLMVEGKVGVKPLASKMGLSVSQLNRRVKEATGQTTSDYVWNARLQEAKRLLGLFPEIPIFETARSCGFADVAHFSHVFRRKVGMSPTQYIQSLKARGTRKKRTI